MGAPKSPAAPPSSVLEVAACKSCGAQLDLRRDEEIASCLFCGSKSMVHTPKTRDASLLDLNGPTLDIGYIEPALSLQDVRNRIIDTIQKDECGLKNTDALAMDIKGVFFPFWKICVKGTCAWTGDNPHEETYTEWQKVTKNVDGRSYETNEPVQKTRTVWTPSSGQACFDETVGFPAAHGLSDVQVKVVKDGFDAEANPSDPPRTDTGFSITSPSISQKKIWSQSILDDMARKASEPCVCRLRHVSPQLQSRSFTLIYLPFAVVRYAVEGSDFRHFVNLQNGNISGDFPLDVSAVANEAALAWQKQKQIDTLNGIYFWIWFAYAVIALFLSIGYYLNGEGAEINFLLRTIFAPFCALFGDDTQQFLAGSRILTFIFSWLGVLIVVITVGWLSPDGIPWKSFIYNRLAFLSRLWLNAPVPVRQALEALYPTTTIEEIRKSIKEAADQNKLNDNIELLGKWDNFADRTAKVLLGFTGTMVAVPHNSAGTSPMDAKPTISLMSYLTFKRCAWAGVGILVIWGGCSLGIRMKQKSDYRNALSTKNYEEVARISITLAPKWEPAAKFLEYWKARQAFESVLKEADLVTFSQGGGEKWAEVESQKQLGEECVSHSSRYQEGKNAYAAALAKFNEIKAMIYQDDGIYVGKWKNGKMNGHGTFTFKDGRKYIGEFKDGRSSQGTLITPEGDKYVGQFKNGLVNGQGTLTTREGTTYIGEFKDSICCGQATKTLVDGTKCVGEFKDNKLNGQGTLSFPNGIKVVGEFKNGLPNGQGTMTSPDGQKYVGKFEDGNFSGLGEKMFPDGKMYVGEFRNGQFNGNGTLTSWDGKKKYVGEFQDDKFHGRGKIIAADGSESKDGIWRNDKYVGEKQ
jgi:hypothetical protein